MNISTKFLRRLSIFTLIPLLVSCSEPNEITKFIYGFSIKDSMTYRTAADVKYTATFYRDKEEIGTKEITYDFSKKDPENLYCIYHEINTGVSITKEEHTKVDYSLSKNEGLETYTISKTTDGTTNSEVVEKNEAVSEITKFYYSMSSDEYYRGGMYYGDFFSKTTIRYNQDLMTLDLAKEELTYYVDHYTDDHGSDLSLKICVDKYGMLQTWSQEIILSKETAKKELYSEFKASIVVNYK